MTMPKPNLGKLDKNRDKIINSIFGAVSIPYNRRGSKTPCYFVNNPSNAFHWAIPYIFK